MIENLTAPENVVFAIALSLFLLIGLVQAASMVMGLEAFSFLEDLAPGAGHGGDAHALAADLSPGVLDSVLSMLRIGRVPMIFTFVLFLFLFSFFGYNGQLVLHELGLPRLHAALATPLAFAITLPFLRWGNGFLAKVLPRDESSAISSDALIGRVAIVLLGTVTSERHAEAKVLGPDGKTHYVQVVADGEGATFGKGDHALIVGKRGEGLFTVIENRNPLLEDNS